MKLKTIGMILLALAITACKPDPSKDYNDVYMLKILLDLLPFYVPGETIYVYSCNAAPEKCYNFYRDTRYQVNRSCYQSELLQTNCPEENSVGACEQIAINNLSVLETVYYSPAHTTDSARKLCPSLTFDTGSRYFLDTYTIRNVSPR